MLEILPTKIMYKNACQSRYGVEIPRACGSGSGQIWLDNVVCVGNESSLAECEHNAWGVNNCGHSEDAACRCCQNAAHCGSNNLCEGSVLLIA